MQSYVLYMNGAPLQPRNLTPKRPYPQLGIIPMSMTETRDQSKYQLLREDLDEYGEIMVHTASGDELELHKHNVEFASEPYIEIEADDEIHWLDTTLVERYWIHKEI